MRVRDISSGSRFGWQILSVAEANGYQYRLLLDEDPFKVNVLIEKTRNEGFIQSEYKENCYSNVERANIPLFRDISSTIKKDIRYFLQHSLPDYMIPQDFIAVKQLPLTSNGKVDRRFLSQREEIILRNQIILLNATQQIQKTI